MSFIRLTFAIFLGFSASSQAREVSVLFLGNSYTYIPGVGEPSDPAIPKFFELISESTDSTLNIQTFANTVGGHSFERHLADAKSRHLLKGRYDHVVLQGHSIGSLQLPPWFHERGNRGVESFAEAFPQLLSLAVEAAPRVAVFVNWGWNFRHAMLNQSHPGLHFPEGHSRAGQRWSGNSPAKLQEMIDESYRSYTRQYPITLSLVGRAWLQLADENVVRSDDLYIEGDWSHASPIGAFVTALVLARDVLKVQIERNTYFPKEVSRETGLKIQTYLAKKPVSH